MKKLLTTTLLLCACLFASGQRKITKADSDTIRRAQDAATVWHPGDGISISDHTFSGMIDAFPKYYTVNWKKVKTLADLKLILQAFNFQISDNAPGFKKIKKFAG